MAETKTSYRINIHPRLARDIVIQFTDPLEGIGELGKKGIIGMDVFEAISKSCLIWNTIPNLIRVLWGYIIGQMLDKYEDIWDLTMIVEKTSGWHKGKVTEVNYPARTLILWMEEN